MRKQRIKGMISWIFVLAVLGTVVFFRDSAIAFYCVVFWFLIPFISTALNLYIRKNLKIEIFCPASAEKGKEQSADIFVENRGKLPVFHSFVRVQMKNRLTKEMTEQDIEIPTVTEKQTKESFSFRSDYCGYLTMKITGVFLMDWFGFLAVRCKENGTQSVAKTVVLPDTFVPQIVLEPAAGSTEDAEEWSPFRKGNDQTETYALRDYAPGDSLRQIHWKLSSKRGQLIIREPSLPEIKTLLLFWNKEGQAEAGEMDTMAEVVSSAAQMLWEMGETFTLGWQQNEESCYMPVGTEEELQRAIAQMLKGEFPVEEQTQNTYAKVIVFGMENQEEGNLPDELKEAQVTEVLCAREPERRIAEPGRIIYCAGTYREDLIRMEL